MSIKSPIDERIIKSVIKKMKKEFTSHEFILRLAQSNQNIYIQELSRYNRGLRRAPFRKLHAAISKELHNYRKLIRYTGHVTSQDIFLHPSRCAKWKKL